MMATKKKAAPRKRSAKPKVPAEEPLREVAEPKPVEGPAEPLMKVAGKPHFAHVPAQPFLPADGTLLRKDGDPVVYVMDKGQRRPFADLAAFHACCGGGATITVLSHEEIDPIPEGPEVTGPADLR